jgi:hypothetical protein
VDSHLGEAGDLDITSETKHPTIIQPATIDADVLLTDMRETCQRRRLSSY